MTTRNEAAERLRRDLSHPYNREQAADLDEALAAAKEQGAREAVERIWAQLLDLPDGVAEGQLSERAVFAILTEELDRRESSLGRDAEGHLVLTLGPGGKSPSRKGQVSTAWEAYDGMSPLEQRHADGDR